jgi:hypothetical protein
MGCENRVAQNPFAHIGLCIRPLPGRYRLRWHFTFASIKPGCCRKYNATTHNPNESTSIHVHLIYVLVSQYLDFALE